MLDRAVVDGLFAPDLPETDHWERHYAPRSLPDGAEVTRFGPSPTGNLHIGGLYTAMLSRDVARHSDGRYLLRVEDTDQAREVAGALAQFARAFDYFELAPDEGPTLATAPDTTASATGAAEGPALATAPGASTNRGDYGPYRQSAREAVYHSYVRQLLREGKAYPCFATREELAEQTARQEAAKVPTGYYGEWATWRDADPALVAERLAAGAPYVVRFRSPNEVGRVSFDDVIRGRLEHEANRNDAVILKSSDAAPRLPTYHLAHVVDDHLMRVTTVVRGEEWISSVPLHLQLFAALDLPVPRYAHVAPLLKAIKGGKRKLSKRKDPEAGVDYYLAAGYPAAAVQYYLRGLANGRLAELPLAEALQTPIRLDRCGVAGPLVDLAKLEDISGDYIASLPSAEVLTALRRWAAEYDPEVAAALDADPELALRALAVEREGVENPRKDLRKWSDVRSAYGFFFPQLFTPVTGHDDERVAALGVPAAAAAAFVRDLVDHYHPEDDGSVWFGQLREAAGRQGFAANAKEYRRDPDAYPGSIREASQLVRVAVTGATRSPDLHAVSRAIGDVEFLQRLQPLAGTS